MQNKPFKNLTIICPIYNEEKVIPLFFQRISPIIIDLSKNYCINLLFLNNASTDNTYAVLKNLHDLHDFVDVITLSKNMGYQRSLECGLVNATGDLIVFIDVDCEDPPEMIPEFIKLYEGGFDLVYGERVDREEAIILKSIRKFFYHLIRRLADEDILLYMAEFSLITSEVRDAILMDKNSFPFIRSSMARVGFNRIAVPYKRHKRIAGKTYYNYLTLTQFAIAGILSTTTLPLRVPIYLFPIWVMFTLIILIFEHTTDDSWLLVVNILFSALYFGGTVAFIALYVARIYKNSLGRPNYIVHKRYCHIHKIRLSDLR
jgi:glycosyltransferase involved in cell wall biosynthesis